MRGATLAHRVVRGGGMNPPPLILRGRCASPGYAGLALVSLRPTSRPPRPPLALVVQDLIAADDSVPVAVVVVEGQRAARPFAPRDHAVAVEVEPAELVVRPPRRDLRAVVLVGRQPAVTVAVHAVELGEVVGPLAALDVSVAVAVQVAEDGRRRTPALIGRVSLLVDDGRVQVLAQRHHAVVVAVDRAER